MHQSESGGRRSWLRSPYLSFIIPFPEGNSSSPFWAGVVLYWALGLFCTGNEPVERVCSVSSALFKTKSNLPACLLKLFTRLIRDKTKARNIKNPKLNNKFRSTTGIK